MNDKTKKPKRRHILRSLLVLSLLLVIVGCGVSFALGWVSFRHGDGVFTIEIRTGQSKADTDRAVKGTRGATVETVKILQGAGKRLEELGGQHEEKETIAPADQAIVPKDRAELGEPPTSTTSGERHDD